MKSNNEILALTKNDIDLMTPTERKTLENRIRRALKRQECDLVKNSKNEFALYGCGCMCASGDIIDAIQWAFATDWEVEDARAEKAGERLSKILSACEAACRQALLKEGVADLYHVYIDLKPKDDRCDDAGIDEILEELHL